jgi:hypothetical protein
VQTWLENNKYIKIDSLPSYIKEQNRAAEHLRDVIKNKTCTIYHTARLSATLWLEINCVAVYLHNWILRYQYE